MDVAASFDTPSGLSTEEYWEPASPGTHAAVSVGRVLGFSLQSGPLIDFPGNTTGILVSARSIFALTQQAVGSEVVLAFQDGDLTRPIILGVLQPPVGTPNEADAAVAVPVEVVSDGNHLLLTAKEEIVLQCGLASITLTRAGKVLIRGEYLLSRSAGTNRVQGSSVQIN